MNALMGEKLAIVSPKVQTTRHRIKGILSEKDYQIIFSDTPGIINPRYKLHEKMMQAVKNALEDADVALLIVDVNDNLEEADAVFSSLKLRVPALLAINKIDLASEIKVKEAANFFSARPYIRKTFCISARQGLGLTELINELVQLLPEGEPFYGEETMTDRPVRFFVSELIREKIYELYEEEIPYHTAVLIKEYSEKATLDKIVAEIIVERETQKVILLGKEGNKIKRLGTEARKEIEEFLQRKVFLELFVKVRPKWRDNELYLKEYGYV